MIPSADGPHIIPIVTSIAFEIYQTLAKFVYSCYCEYSHCHIYRLQDLLDFSQICLLLLLRVRELGHFILLILKTQNGPLSFISFQTRRTHLWFYFIPKLDAIELANLCLKFMYLLSWSPFLTQFLALILFLE